MSRAGSAFSVSQDRQDLVEGSARVVALDGDTVWLEPEQTTSCGGCASASACGTKSGNSAGWLMKRRFAMANEHGLAVGDRVVVGIAAGGLLRASATAYGLPLLMLLGGGLTAKSMGGGDGAAAMATLAGLVVGLGLAKLWAGRQLARGDLSPRFIRRAFGPGPGGGCHVD